MSDETTTAAVLAMITPKDITTHEHAGSHPQELFRSLLRTGLAEALVRSSSAGSRWHFCSEIASICERWVGLGESLHLQTLVALTVARHGTPMHRDRYLDGILSGEIIAANCLNEHDAGSDLAAMRVKATRVSGGYRIDGCKQWIGHAPIADVLLVYSRTSGSGLRGLTCLLADRDTPGVTVRDRPKTSGAASLPCGDIEFDSVFVADDAVVGRPGRAMLAADGLFTQGRIGAAACAVGLARAALRRAVGFARTHHQFGQPIMNFQGISFPLAEASTEVAASESLLREACSAIEATRPDAELRSAQAKLKATSTAILATNAAVSTLGSHAYNDNEQVLRWAAEARLLDIIQGTREMQKLAIGAQLR